MLNNHPILTDDPIDRDAKLRKILGMSDEQTISPDLIERLQSHASLKTDDVTRDLRLTNIATKMNRLGMTGENNLATNLLIDKSKQEGSQIFSEEMMNPEQVLEAPSGTKLRLENWGLEIQGFGTRIARTVVAMPKAVEEWKTLATGVLAGTMAEAAESVGLNKDASLFRTIAKEQLSLKDETVAETMASLQAMESAVGVPLEDKARYLEGLIALNDRKMAGTLGITRWAGRGLGNIGIEVANFAGASTLGFLASGGNPAGAAAGLDLMFLNVANSHAWDVYDETGDATQAIFSGVLNFSATKAIMGRGHVAIGAARKKLAQVVPKLTIDQRGRIAGHLERGEINPIMAILKTHSRFAAETVLLREVEYGLNAAYQEHFALNNKAARFEFSIENAVAVAGHAIQEFAVLSILPMVQQTLGHGATFVPLPGMSKVRAAKALDYWTNGMHGFTEMLHGNSVKGLGKVRERYVAQVGENPTNPVHKFQLELIDIEISSKTPSVPGEAPRVSKLKDIAKEIESESNQTKKFAMWDEATSTTEITFGKFEQSNKVDTSLKLDNAVQPARHKTNEEFRQDIANESQKSVEKTKRETDKEITVSEKESIGVEREKSVEELTLEMLFNDPKSTTIKATKVEIQKLRNKDKLTKEESVRLETLEESVETAAILRGKQKDTDVEFGETGRLRADQLEQKINIRNEAIKRKQTVESFVLDTVAKLKTKIKSITEADMTAEWSAFVKKVETKFGEKNAEIVEAVKSAVRGNKKDENGNAIFTDKTKLTNAINRAEKKLAKLTELKDGTKTMLSWRTDKVGSRLTPMLDNVITSIKKAVDKTWEKGEDYKKTIEDYFIKKGEHFNETRAESLEASAEIIKIVKKVEKAKGDYSVLDVAQSAKLESFIKDIYDQSNFAFEIKMARAEAEVVLYDKAITREIINARLTDGKKSEWDDASNSLFVDIVKGLSYGMKENGRLTDYAEYISGGNSTVAHKILYQDVIKGYKDARQVESKMHFLLDEIYNSKKYRLTDREVVSVNSNQAKNTRGNKKFKPAVIIERSGQKNIELASHEVVHILMLARDSSNLALWEKGAGIKIKGLHDSIRGKNQLKNIEQVIEKAGEIEKRVANANVEFVNSAQVKKLVKEVGLRVKGKDILEERAPGDNFMFRQRMFEKEAAPVSLKETKITTLFDAMKSEAGLGDMLNSTARTNILESRVSTAKYDIVVTDGTNAMNNWIHSLSVLRHLDKPLTLAQNVVRGKEFTGQKEALGRAIGKGQKIDRLSSKLMENIEKNFYKPMIQSEMGYMRGSNDVLSEGFRAIRSVTQTAKLGLKLAVMAYQSLSLIPAARNMDKGGKRAILQAIMENTTGLGKSNKKLHERALRNSGLYWERTIVGNAQALTSGTSSQATFLDAIAAGKKIDRTNYTNKEQIKRVARASMKGISGVDSTAVRILYRATEIHVKNRWDAQGKKMEGNEALFNEIVRREFEDNLVDSQPFYNPFGQPANINKAPTETGWAALTMFRGLTGKLSAQKRIAILRASRALRQGNNREAAGHIAEGIHKTLVTATLIPLVRRAANVGMAYGAGNIIDTMFDINMGVKWDDAKAEALEDVWFDVLSGTTSMTPAGSVFTSGVLNTLSSSAGLTEGYKYTGDFSPAIQTIQNVISIDPTSWTPKQTLNNTTTLLNILGLPEEIVSQLKRTMKLKENADKRSRDNNVRRVLGF